MNNTLSDSTTTSSDSSHLDAPEEATRSFGEIILLMILLTFLNNFLLNKGKQFRVRWPLIGQFLPDTIITTALGMIFGATIHFAQLDNILFIIRVGYEQFFIIILLPPILFESAIHMKREYFFQNFGSILVLAILGTFIASFFTGMLFWAFGQTSFMSHFSFVESMIFSSLISATDPVTVLSAFKEASADQNLYSLILGESLLNDSVGLILFRSVTQIYEKMNQMLAEADEQYISMIAPFFFIQFFGSALLGISLGMIASWITKKVDISENNLNHVNQEIAIMILVPWISYLFGEITHLSGIVSIISCGICISHYAMGNMSIKGEQLTNQIYHAFSVFAENMIFLFIGIGLVGFDLEIGKIGIGTIIIGFFILIISRALGVGICAWLLNSCRKNNKINKSYIFMMWFSGFRGAMAFAMALMANELFDFGSKMISLTLIYAAITIIIFGSLLNFVMKKCDVFQEEGQTNKISDYSTLRNEFNACSKLKDYLRLLDEKYLKKILTRGELSEPSKMERLTENNVIESIGFKESNDDETSLIKEIPQCIKLLKKYCSEN